MIEFKKRGGNFVAEIDCEGVDQIDRNGAWMVLRSQSLTEGEAYRCKEQLNKLFPAEWTADNTYTEEQAFDNGYDEGFQSGQDDVRDELDRHIELAEKAEDDAYNNGYKDGLSDVERERDLAYENGYDQGFARCAENK